MAATGVALAIDSRISWRPRAFPQLRRRLIPGTSMSYQALMVHVELDGEVEGRVRLAAELARRFEAALIGVSGWAPQPAFVADSNVIEVAPEEIDVQAMSDLLKERGEGFRAAAGAGIAVEW